MINWIPISELPEEYRTNKKEVLIKTFVGIVSAWAHISTVMEDDWCGHEGTTYYDWVCYDDMFRLDFDDNTVTHFAEFSLGGKMKSILEFNMPEDKNDFKLAMNGADYFCVLWDIKQLLRDYYKYNNMNEKGLVTEIQSIMDEVYLDDIE